MFRCYSKLFKFSKNNAGSIPKNGQPARPYSKTPFKRPTMDEMPVPSGSWSAHYAKKNTKNNLVLLLGTGVFGATLAYMCKSDVINFGRGPTIGKNEPEEAPVEAAKSTSTSAPSTTPLKSSATPKSEPETTLSQSELVSAAEGEVVVVELESDAALASSSKDSVIIIDTIPDSDAPANPPNAQAQSRLEN